MNRTLKVLIGAALVSLVSLTTATAQTGTLQGQRLFLSDGGVGPLLNRIGVVTPPFSILSSDYMITLPPNPGNPGDILYTPDGLGTLMFTSGGGLFWQLNGNAGTTPWNGTTGNYVGTSDNQPLVINATDDNSILFYNGSPSTMKMELNYEGNLGVGINANSMYRGTFVDWTGNYDGGLFQTTRTNGVSLVAHNLGAGGKAIAANAYDVGVGIGANIAPVNGIEVDAQGVGLLINKTGTAPAVGVSMDGSATGLIIENSTYGIDIDGTGTGLYVRNAATSIDANGTVIINNNHNASVTINTGTATGSTTIGSATAGPISLRSTGDIMFQVDGGGDDLVFTGVGNDELTTKVLTIDGANNVRYRNVSGTGTIITGSGTVNQIPKWTPGTTTLGNSNISDNGALVTVASAMSQTGAGAVTFAGNTTANGGLNVNGATNLTGATVQTGTFGVTGATTINTAGGALTTIGGANTVRIAAVDVEMTALPAGLPTDDFVTIAGSDVRRVTAANMINGTAWKLGGNSAPVSNLFGTTTAHDVVFVTGVGGTPRFTLTAAGALTQAPAGGVVTFTGNTNATNGLNVTGATNLTGVTTQAGALGVTGATTINTGGGASTSIGNAAGGAVSIASGTSVTIDPGAGAGNVVIPNIDLDAATTKILTLDGANNVRHRTITAGTNIVTGAGTANRVTRWTPDGATIGNSVMTDDGTNVGISTTGTINIASTTSNDVTINVSGAGGNDLVLTGIDSDPATTTVLTLDASGNVRTRALSGGPGIITGAGTLNTIAMWTPDGMTLGNSTITQNAGATLVTITNALTQAGGGQVIFSGNVDANGGLDVNGATNLTGATVQTGSFAVTGATTINTAGAALTTIGGANTVRIAATDVEMTALPAGATTDDFVTINGTNDVRRVSAATMINGTAWKLGGNASPVSNLFGTTTAHDVVFVTGVGGTPRFTLTAAGALTQAPAGGVVTFTGNTNATNGLNVTGATNLTGITTQAGAFGVTGATTINTGGASTTSIGHVGGGAVSLASASTVTLDPSAAGNIKALNVDQDETTTKVMTLDGSDNVRWRTVSATGTILTGSGTPNRHARWATATTLTDGLIDDNGATITFLTNDVRVQGSTPVYTANSAPGTRKILVMNTADGQIQQAAFPVVTYGNRSLRVSGAELVPSTFTDDGTNFNLTTTGTITLASTTASDIVVDVTGAGGNDLTLLGIDVNTTATDVLVLDASGNVRKRSIGGGPNPIVTGSGTLNTIPKWTPDGFTLGNSNLTDDGSTVTVSSAASFNTNGHTNLGDATTDNVVVRGNLRTTGAANQFAGRVMITGAGGATTFTVSNNLVQANSIIIVSLEDGTNTSDFTATVRNKVVTTGFDVRLSAPLAAGQTKWINYQIINQ